MAASTPNTTVNSPTNNLSRTAFKAVYAIEKEEGVGARVRRSIGTAALRNLTPFLMLDHFSVAPGAGFPDHPHRGQTTVTYMINGKNQHEDITGNKGLLEPGDVQWMTAGRGIVHSEMPYFDDPNPETAVRAEGMQLWVDLPEDKKFCEPSYQEKKAKEIDTVHPADGVSITVISGESHGITGFVRPVGGCWYMDFKFSSVSPAKGVFQPLPEGWTAFAYIIKGSLAIGDDSKVYGKHTTVVLSTQPGQNGVQLKRPSREAIKEAKLSDEETHLVLIAGEPLKQRVVQYGPFVVNTAEQARQAVMDYQMGVNGFEGAPGWRSEIGKAMRHQT